MDDTASVPDSRPVINLGSRKSSLALIQTNEVKGMLEQAHPHLRFEIVTSSTLGDDVQTKALAELGASNPGLFTKQLEVDLLSGKVRLAVHSLKDMPTRLPDGLTLSTICKREDPEDAVLIHPKHKHLVTQEQKDVLGVLPEGSVLGTSSLRREALVKGLFPHMRCVCIRGNIQTRIAKLDEADDYDAILLAVAGLRRADLGQRIDEVLDPDRFPYGVSQGSIGIEIRADDDEMRELLAPIEHLPSALRCTAERACLCALEGGCQVPLGVRSSVEEVADGDATTGGALLITVTCVVMSLDGATRIEETVSGPCADKAAATALGEELALALRAKGAGALLGPPGEKRPLTYGSAETAGIVTEGFSSSSGGGGTTAAAAVGAPDQ